LITGGICISYWLDFGMSFVDPNTASWRFPIAFQIVFALVILAVILELPESPRWLILQGKEDEALNVLSALSDLSSDDPYVHNEFTEIKDSVLEMESASFKDLFTMGKFRPPRQRPARTPHFHPHDSPPALSSSSDPGINKLT
jgi:MFS family permease